MGPRTISEVAALLRVSDRFVYRQVSSGQWPCHRLGVLYRFTDEDVAAIFDLTARPAEPAPSTLPSSVRLVTNAEKAARARSVKASQTQRRRQRAAATG